MPNSLPLSYTFAIPFPKKELKQHNKSKTSSNLREPPVELIKSLISLVGSWASNSSNWLMIASTTKSSMLLLRNTILIIVAILGFLFWFIVRPNVLKFHVTDASLTRFDYTTNNTLHYDLALNVSIRNPNRRVGVYYDHIEAHALYQDVLFGNQTLGPFFQHHKNTTFPL